MSKQIAQILIGVVGGINAIIALIIIAAPQWFYANIGYFPPFNRHYMGDAGTFLLAIGLGLLIAARDPWKHRLMVGVGVLASVLHTLNHAYDAVIGGASLVRWLTDLGPLVLFIVMLVVVYAQMRPTEA